MKVAFLGDMNNNYFSFLRYLNDRGVESHLFLYKDHCDHYPRWCPKYDSKQFDEKWKRFVHPTDIRPSWKSLLKPDKKTNLQLASFDIVFASGVAVSYCFMNRIKVNYYFPYAVGFEILNRKLSLKRLDLTINLLRLVQYIAVKRADFTVLTFGEYQSLERARRMKLKTLMVPTIPMVYFEESEISPKVKQIIQDCAPYSFIVSSHVRHDWKGDETHETRTVEYSKGTDVLIRGFAKFIEKYNIEDAVLLFAEYGCDVDESKNLISRLGIEKYVLWYSELKRSEILELISHCDVSCAEISTYALTSGVLNESMGSGLPTIQSIDVARLNAYYKDTLFSAPPVLNAQNDSDVMDILWKCYVDPSFREEISSKSKEWFNNEVGIGLADYFINHFKSFLV